MKANVTITASIERLARREIQGFTIIERTCLPNAVLASSDYPYTVIGVLLKGSVKRRVGSGFVEYENECLMVNPAEEPQYYEIGRNGAQGLQIDLSPERLATIQDYAKLPNYPVYPKNRIWYVIAQRILKELSCEDSASVISIEGLVLELVAQIARCDNAAPSSSAPEWLKRVRDLCNEQFDQSINLSSISRQAGIHPAHLARTFRAHYNLTVGEYIRRLRVNHAIRELIHTDRSLVEIASAAGFYDQSHFTHIFRLQTGMSPSEYRAGGRAAQM